MPRIILLLFFVLGLMSAGQSQNLYFPPLTGSQWDTISPGTLHWCPAKIDSLYRFLDSNNTKSFILLKDGKIVLEKYFGSQTQNSAWYWASAGKTLTAFLTGIAQQEHSLSISDTTSEYLGAGWTSCPAAKEQKITIRHQLTMTTGLDDAVPDPYCTLDTCLIYKADAGTRWAYHNAPYTLLDKVIEQATGMTLNGYTGIKLLTPTGMTGAFYLVDYNNLFFSTARSMARFGLLILNRGNWNGNQIMTDTAYFRQMTHTSQSLNQAYGYLWWLNGSASFMVPQSQIIFPGMMCPSAPPDMIAAMGKNGQFLNVVPSQKMVWVRMGDAPDNGDVPFLLNDRIWSYLNNLECNTSVDDKSPQNIPTCRIETDKIKRDIQVTSDKVIQSVTLFDPVGRILTQNREASRVISIPMNHKACGILILKINFQNGAILVKKLIDPL